MRFSVVRKLAQLNLIYSMQVAQMDKYRKKQADNPGKKINVTRKILLQYLFAGVLYLFIFGSYSLGIPFEELPGMFTRFLGIFILMTMLQAFLSMYNVFYESKDLQSYRSLPVTELEVFLGKGAVVLIACLTFLLPLLLYLVLIHFRFGNAFWWGIPLALLSFILLFTGMTLVTIVAVHFLTKTNVFRQYKKLASGAIMVISTIGSVIAILTLQNTSLSFMDGQIVESGPGFAPLWLFYGLAENPLSMKVGLHLLVWLLVLAGLAWVVKNQVLPNFYEAALATSTAVSQRKTPIKVKQQKGQRTWKQQLWHYHLGLIADPTMLFTFVIMTSMLVIMMMVPTLIGARDLLMSIDYHIGYLSMAVFFGMAYAIMSAGGLSGIIISLDRENFNFFKTMPFDMMGYLRFKFWFAFLIEAILPTIVLLVLTIWLQLPFYLFLGAWIAWLLTAYSMETFYFVRDFRLLELNWQNVTQLANRGMGNVAKTIVVLVSFVIFIGLIVFAAIMLQSVSILVNLILAGTGLIVLIVIAGVSYSLSRNYWRKQELG
ncbi:hypothetical protein [Streptococcus moroccensis]|uniref:ABC-2 type transport system permease protein n=1 Tax=Streptococcus moroccensis TaxID=1451356 RepID=A0ABT9YUT1_9STRE|nr:hypothetical protein [Streptococcus moroccensis]MDQ0223357.1 ABC-2 type transport system permease protein [Streptococcus moroccensis]